MSAEAPARPLPRRTRKTGKPMSRNATSDRTIDALMLFDDDTLELTVSEMAARLGAARSTTYRYIHSMRDYGLLEEASSGALRPGPLVERLAGLRRRSNLLSERALPAMQRLAQETGEAVILTRLRSGAVICEQRVDAGRHALRIVYERDQVLPLNEHVGAAAIVLLAHVAQHDAQDLLAQASAARKGADAADIAFARVSLNRTRVNGFIIMPPHARHGVRGVAAVVRSPRQDVLASLGVIGPNVRMPDARMVQIVKHLRAACRAIEAAIDA